MSKNEEKILCPSARAQPGAQLVGIRQANGTVAILPQALKVTTEFINIASNDGIEPEKKFRFSNKCVEHGCAQWTGVRCGVADRIAEQFELLMHHKEDRKLPECAIRSQCRWFKQLNAQACEVCPYVVTKISEEEIDAYFENAGKEFSDEKFRPYL